MEERCVVNSTIFELKKNLLRKKRKKMVESEKDDAEDIAGSEDDDNEERELLQPIKTNKVFHFDSVKFSLCNSVMHRWRRRRGRS
jgi:hypothetical protein